MLFQYAKFLKVTLTDALWAYFFLLYVLMSTVNMAYASDSNGDLNEDNANITNTTDEINEAYESISEDEDNQDMSTLINSCLNMKPKMRPDPSKSKVGKRKLKAIFDRNPTDNISKLGVVTRNQTKSTSSSSGPTGSVRDSVEGLFKDMMQSDFTALQTHVTNVNRKINDIFDVLRNYSDRIYSLESNDNEQHLQIMDLESRLIKHEYINSENGRKTRFNQIILTHPEINATGDDLNNLISKFVQRKFQVPQAKLQGLIARKIGSDSHTVHITFPGVGIVGELFKIKKQLWNEKKDNNLFLNEYLTPCNYNLLKTIKDVKAACIKKKQPVVIFSAFNFHGRVYIKKSKESDRILIKDKFDTKKLFHF